MKKNLIITLIAVFCVLVKTYSQNSFSDRLSIRGYVKDMPMLTLDKDFSNPEFNNILHNRLNLGLRISYNFRFSLEGRNRLFYNEMFSEFPMIKDVFEHDDGLIDMSWVWLSDGPWLGHSEIDRLFLDWRADNWQVRVGRQRINWGVNFVSNPNDLFNTYSFFDFDYPERPGTDAIRVQYFIDHASRIQMAYSPGRNSKETVAATMFNFNQWNYDMQILFGYYKNRAAVGGGWAGNIKGAGFKGEATWFYDIEETSGIERGNLVASVGIDYVFGKGTFGVFEVLYNGGYQRNPDAVMMITEPLQADNIMFSEYAATISISHPFTPIFNGGISVMALPDIEAFFISPNVSYSVITNLDIEILAQIFSGGKNSIFHEYAGSAWIASLKYSF